jgi:ribonuclease P protein component
MPGRLTRKGDFERVRTQGARWRGKFCALNAARAAAAGAASDEAQTRIGYIASKALGNAVCRNRARRVLKEAVRGLTGEIPDGWDIVLIAHSSIIAERARMQQVQEDARWLLTKAQIIRPASNARPTISPIEKSPSSPTPPAPVPDTPSSTKS